MDRIWNATGKDGQDLDSAAMYVVWQLVGQDLDCHRERWKGSGLGSYVGRMTSGWTGSGIPQGKMERIWTLQLCRAYDIWVDRIWNTTGKDGKDLNSAAM